MSMQALPPVFFDLQLHTDAPTGSQVWALAHPASQPSDTPEQARSQARASTRDVLREQLALLVGCEPEALALSDVRGQAPQLIRWPASVPPAWRDGLHLSLAHADGRSLVALHGPAPTAPKHPAQALTATSPSSAQAARVAGLALKPTGQAAITGLGVDLQAITLMPAHECLAIAQLYLHPADASALQAQHTAGAGDVGTSDEASLALHFAQAWALHEARLKAAGLALTEWSPALQAALQQVDARPLRLPAAWTRTHAAALAWRQAL